VAYRPVAKPRLCKQRPLLGNARNRTVFSMWFVPIYYKTGRSGASSGESSVRESVKTGHEAEEWPLLEPLPGNV
jgi:hypothetical protein